MGFSFPSGGGEIRQALLIKLAQDLATQSVQGAGEYYSYSQVFSIAFNFYWWGVLYLTSFVPTFLAFWN